MSDQDRIWTLITDMPTCMMVTHDDGALRARPMHAVPERDRNEIWFYTRLSSGKSAELAQDGDVCLCFGCPRDSVYVSVTGQARVTQDRAMIKKHWSRFVDAWFPNGQDGPDVGMICVSLSAGEYWDGESSNVLAAMKMLKASATDRTPDMGDNEKVAFG